MNKYSNSPSMKKKIIKNIKQKSKLFKIDKKNKIDKKKRFFII